MLQCLSKALTLPSSLWLFLKLMSTWELFFTLFINTDKGPADSCSCSVCCGALPAAAPAVGAAAPPADLHGEHSGEGLKNRGSVEEKRHKRRALHAVEMKVFAANTHAMMLECKCRGGMGVNKVGKVPVLQWMGCV